MIWIGIALFFGVHVMTTFTPFRDRLTGLLSLNGYKGAFSLISLLGLVLMGMGYSQMDYQELWAVPVWGGGLAMLVMPVVVILWVSSEMKGHIRQKIKHPMVLGMLLWALVHLVNNGDRASLYLFGAFAVYSVFSIVSSNRRSKLLGKFPDYSKAKITHDLAAIGLGLMLSAGIVFWAHEFLFGVAPF